jgi:hypothetical protein
MRNISNILCFASYCARLVVYYIILFHLNVVCCVRLMCTVNPFGLAFVCFFFILLFFVGLVLFVFCFYSLQVTFYSLLQIRNWKTLLIKALHVYSIYLARLWNMTMVNGSAVVTFAHNTSAREHGQNMVGHAKLEHIQVTHIVNRRRNFALSTINFKYNFVYFLRFILFSSFLFLCCYVSSFPRILFLFVFRSSNL